MKVESGRQKVLYRISSNFIKHQYLKILNIDVSKYFEEVDYVEAVKDSESGLIYFRPSIVGDGFLYKSLQKFEWYYGTNKWEFHKGIEFIAAKDDRILEVGCGDGQFLKLLSSQGIENLTGIDSSLDEIDFDPNLNLFNKSLQDFSYDKLFDNIFAFQLLEHIEDPLSFLSKVKSLLKTGGHFIFAVPNNDGFIKFKSDNILNMPPHHQILWTKNSIEKVANILGFKLIGIHYEPINISKSKFYYQSIDNLNFYLPEMIKKLFKNTLSLQEKFLPDSFKSMTLLAVYEKR